MDVITYGLLLNTRYSGCRQQIQLYKGEANARKLSIELCHGTEPVILDPLMCIAIIRGVKADKTVLFNTATVTEKGKVEYTLGSQDTAAVGETWYEVQIISKDESDTKGRLLYSAQFKAVVSDTVADDGKVTSSDEFGLLTDTIASNKEWVNQKQTELNNWMSEKSVLIDERTLILKNVTTYTDADNTTPELVHIDYYNVDLLIFTSEWQEKDCDAIVIKNNSTGNIGEIRSVNEDGEDYALGYVLAGKKGIFYLNNINRYYIKVGGMGPRDADISKFEFYKYVSYGEEVKDLRYTAVRKSTPIKVPKISENTQIGNEINLGEILKKGVYPEADFQRACCEAVNYGHNILEWNNFITDLIEAGVYRNSDFQSGCVNAINYAHNLLNWQNFITDLIKAGIYKNSDFQSGCVNAINYAHNSLNWNVFLDNLESAGIFERSTLLQKIDECVPVNRTIAEVGLGQDISTYQFGQMVTNALTAGGAWMSTLTSWLYGLCGTKTQQDKNKADIEKRVAKFKLKTNNEPTTNANEYPGVKLGDICINESYRAWICEYLHEESNTVVWSEILTPTSPYLTGNFYTKNLVDNMLKEKADKNEWELFNTYEANGETGGFEYTSASGIKAKEIMIIGRGLTFSGGANMNLGFRTSANPYSSGHKQLVFTNSLTADNTYQIRGLIKRIGTDEILVSLELWREQSVSLVNVAKRQFIFNDTELFAGKNIVYVSNTVSSGNKINTGTIEIYTRGRY